MSLPVFAAGVAFVISDLFETSVLGSGVGWAKIVEAVKAVSAMIHLMVRMLERLKPLCQASDLSRVGWASRPPGIASRDHELRKIVLARCQNRRAGRPPYPRRRRRPSGAKSLRRAALAAPARRVGQGKSSPRSPDRSRLI